VHGPARAVSRSGKTTCFVNRMARGGRPAWGAPRAGRTGLSTARRRVEPVRRNDVANVHKIMWKSVPCRNGSLIFNV
ncbi:unnamed protein product, partial [Acidocella sp. C78]